MEWCKTQYMRDLRDLGKLFKKHDTDSMFKNLDSTLNIASNKLQKPKTNILSINVPSIEIILKKKISGTIPPDLQSITIYLELLSEFDLSKDLQSHDRILDSYSLQLEIKGINSKGEHYNAWHLDKDIRKGGNAPHYDHPLYHFQPGGNRLEAKTMQGAIFIGSPRLPHPPMDVILALHFILRNFCSTKTYRSVKSLLNEPQYLDIVDRAKKRMFTPYFKAFDSGYVHEAYTLANVFPLAV